MSVQSLQEINLKYSRNDVTATETNTKNCLRVLPVGKKSRQKVIVADQTGSALMFQVGKHHELKSDFKTVPEAKGISCIELFGDQVFLASGSRVSAYTKKGRPFFALETNMSETISNLRVDTPYLFVGGDYVLTRFSESTELGYYMSPDRIHALQIRKVPGGNDGDFDCFIGCQDRVIRTVRSDAMKAEYPVEGPVQCLEYFVHSEAPEVTDLIYGTLSGSIGGFSIGSKNELIRKFTVIPSGRTGAVFSLASADISKDGYTDIVAGRDDGTIELFSFNRDPAATPFSVWTDNVGECINTVATGCVTNSARDEIVLHTYTGKVLTFTVSEADQKNQMVVRDTLAGPQQNLDAQAREAAATTAPPLAEVDQDVTSKQQILQAKEAELAGEIYNLRVALQQKKAEFAQVSSGNTISMQQAHQVAAFNMRAVSSQFKVRERLETEATGTVAIHLEVDTPIDSVGVQADVDLELVDYGDAGSAAIILPSQVPSNAKTTKLSAVAKCAEGETNKMILRFRTMEGQQGNVSCFIIPVVTPRSAQLKQFTIRPLSLHQRADFDPSQLPLSSVTITGPFSANDVHAWVAQCLPDVPQKFSSQSGELKLYFQNTFLGTHLVASYGKGEAVFSSENFTTLEVLKKYITKEATNRRIAVNISSQIHPDSIASCVQKLHPMIEYQFGLLHKQSIVEALREVESQEGATDFLSDDYQQVLKDAANIDLEAKRQPKRAEYLQELGARLLTDIHAFKGGRGGGGNRATREHLHHLLTEGQYNGEALMELFLN